MTTPSDADKIYHADGAGTGTWKLAPVLEPKGVDSAASEAVYTANGAGSGTWNIPQYAGMNSKESDTITIATIGTTPKKLAGFSRNDPSSGAVPTFATDDITITVAGDYMVNMYVSFATVAAGDAGNYQFHVMQNLVETEIGFHRDESGASDNGVGAASGIHTFTVSDIVSVYVESDEAGNTDDIAIYSCGLSLVLLKAS